MIKKQMVIWKATLALSLIPGVSLPIWATDTVEIIKIEDRSDITNYPLAPNNNTTATGLNNQYNTIVKNFKITVSAIGGNAKNNSGVASATTTAIGILNDGIGSIKTGNNMLLVTATGGVSTSISTNSTAYTTATGIRNDGNGSIKTGNNILTVTTTGGYSSSFQFGANTNANSYTNGVLNDGSGTIETGNNTFTITSIGGSASSTSASANAYAYGINNRSNTLKTGSNALIVTAIGGTATGATATADARATGIYADNSNNNGVIITKGYQNIFVQSTAGLANGTLGKAYAYALLSINGGKIILDNQGEAVQLTGDIAVYRNSDSIEVSLDNKSSYWRPVFQDRWNSAVNGTFGTGRFTIENGGVLDLAWSSNLNGNRFSNKHLTLTGSQVNIRDGAIFVINSNLAQNQADKITSSAIASGTQYVQVVYDPAMDKDGTVTGRATVLDFTGANGQGLTSKIETPLGNYFVTVGMDGGDLVSLTRTSETSQLGKTASDMYRHQANILRLQNSGTLVRRLGDLWSEGVDKHYGAWARTYGGKLKSDGAYGHESSQKYYALQAGFDWIKEHENNKYLFGLLVDQMNADSDFRRGGGDIHSTAFGGYMTWLSENGYYADLVLKAAHMDTKYHAYSDSGRRSSADFSNWGYSMNIEYGYHYNVTPSSYLVPQAELLLGYLQSKNYTSSDGLKIKQDSLNITVGRLGLLYGRSFGEGNLSNAYVRGSVLHDFSGSGSLEGSYNGANRKIETADDFGTSFEMNLGTNIKVSANNQLYAEVAKSFGGDVKSDYQMNVGWRISW